jgi:hypothetical protein
MIDSRMSETVREQRIGDRRTNVGVTANRLAVSVPSCTARARLSSALRSPEISPQANLEGRAPFFPTWPRKIDTIYADTTKM